LDNHPALLMWSVGNELISRTTATPDAPILKYVNAMIAYVKKRSKVPVTHILVHRCLTFRIAWQ
jgi:beta-galactosidase/beta-glucuronidase